MKIILLEKQIKQLITKVAINEQQASEFAGGTDAQRITHAFLSKNFSLPDGSKHENYFYGANIKDVINMSKNNDRNKYLSIFEPHNTYTKNPNDVSHYMDSIYVNDDYLINSGSKTFTFTNGMVFASHNGLLALVRAMDHMGGNGGMLTISFGSNTSGKKSETERTGGGVNFNSDRAMNQGPSINGVNHTLVMLSISPYYRRFANFDGLDITLTNDKIIELVNQKINNTVMGYSGFMDYNRSEEIVKNLIPKGYITKIDFDITPLAEKLISLQQINEEQVNSYGGKNKFYNEDKKEQIESLSMSIEGGMVEKIKEAYLKNFEIYVKNYLPNSAAQLIPRINSVKFDHDWLSEWYYIAFNSWNGGSFQTSSNLTKKETKYKTGN